MSVGSPAAPDPNLQGVEELQPQRMCQARLPLHRDTDAHLRLSAQRFRGGFVGIPCSSNWER